MFRGSPMRSQPEPQPEPAPTPVLASAMPFMRPMPYVHATMPGVPVPYVPPSQLPFSANLVPPFPFPPAFPAQATIQQQQQQHQQQQQRCAGCAEEKRQLRARIIELENIARSSTRAAINVSRFAAISASKRRYELLSDLQRKSKRKSKRKRDKSTTLSVEADVLSDDRDKKRRVQVLRGFATDGEDPVDAACHALVALSHTGSESGKSESGKSDGGKSDGDVDSVASSGCSSLTEHTTPDSTQRSLQPHETVFKVPKLGRKVFTSNVQHNVIDRRVLVQLDHFGRSVNATTLKSLSGESMRLVEGSVCDFVILPFRAGDYVTYYRRDVRHARDRGMRHSVTSVTPYVFVPSSVPGGRKRSRPLNDFYFHGGVKQKPASLVF